MSVGGSFPQIPSSGGGTGNNPFTSQQPPQQNEPTFRTADFQDFNGNGTDDRDEGPSQQPQQPQVDRSLGFGRQFQQPSFINPFMGGYGFNQPYGGGFGGGFGNPFGAILSGLGSLFGGYNPMPYGGYQSYQSPQPQFPGNAYIKPFPPMAPPSPPPPIGAPVPNPYSNIMPSQPLEPPTGGGSSAPAQTHPFYASFGDAQKQSSLMSLAQEHGWSSPIRGGPALSPEQTAAMHARDAEEAANFLKEKGVQYDDTLLQNMFQKNKEEEERRIRERMASNNNAGRPALVADPSVPAFALPSIQRGSGRDQFSIDPYDQQQAQMAAMRRISPSPYMSMGGIGSLFGGGGRPAPPMGGQVLQPMIGLSLAPDDPMFGMPSAPPAMSPDTARIPGGLEAYDQQVKNWEQQTGMKAGDWYKKRDEAVEWRNKQAANAPAAPPPVAAQAQAQPLNFRSPYLNMGGLGSFFGGGGFRY